MSLQDGIVVHGVGRVSAVPDVVEASLGCEARAGSVGPALEEVVAALGRMRQALLDRGVGARDLAVEDTNVHGEQHYETSEVSYVAVAGLAVTVREPAAAGGLVSAAVAAGGDAARLHGLRRVLSRPDDVLPRARELAVADARRKAEHYAELAGRSLGRVLALEEYAHVGERPFTEQSEARVAAAAGDLPYEAGTTDVRALVQVRWELV